MVDVNIPNFITVGLIAMAFSAVTHFAMTVAFKSANQKTA